MRAALAAALLLLLGCRESIVTAPSLLLVSAGALRADQLPCYGAAGTDGAAICGLAERGALFLWAFSPEPEPAPAAAGLLTSLPGSEHGVGVSAATFLRSGTATLASELRAGGLATAAFVSAPELNHSRHLQLGFDDYVVTAQTAPAASARATTDAFRAWLETHRPSQQAWFVWLHYPGVGPLGSPRAAWSLADLDREVDLAFGAARARVDASALGVALCALAGEAGAGSAPLALERVRIPLVWRPPGGVAAQRLAAPVALTDLAPTLLQEAGLPSPTAMVGEPLRVAPLPPAEARPARPVPLRSGGEIGVVASRRYYARAVRGEVARTALLPDDGALPRPTRTRTASEAARPYEAELAPAEEETFRPSGSAVPSAAAPQPLPAGRPLSTH